MAFFTNIVIQTKRSYITGRPAASILIQIMRRINTARTGSIRAGTSKTAGRNRIAEDTGIDLKESIGRTLADTGVIRDEVVLRVCWG